MSRMCIREPIGETLGEVTRNPRVSKWLIIFGGSYQDHAAESVCESSHILGHLGSVLG